MIGDATLFQRADMVEAGWCVVQPILDVWKALPPRRFPNYAAGTWGPAEAEELMSRARAVSGGTETDADGPDARPHRLGLPHLLDRDPESEDVILPKMRGYQNTRDLRNDIVTSQDTRRRTATTRR